MAFYARIIFDNIRPPMKVYVHDAGHEAFSSAWGAKEHMVKIIDTWDERFFDVNYVLAALWAKAHTKIAEVFCYKGIETWPGNPEVFSYVFKNGKLWTRERNIEDEDTTIMRGMEGMHRRETKNLAEYIATHPHLGKLEPSTKL